MSTVQRYDEHNDLEANSELILEEASRSMLCSSVWMVQLYDLESWAFHQGIDTLSPSSFTRSSISRTIQALWLPLLFPSPWINTMMKPYERLFQ